MLIESLDEYEMPVLNGYPYPVEPSYQDCSYCGLWFSPVGIDSHEENCPVRKSPYLDFDGTRIVARRCSDCGSWGGIHTESCSKVGVGESGLEGLSTPRY